MTIVLGPAACRGCRRPLTYGWRDRGSDVAARWRNPNGSVHRCQAGRVDDELGPVRTCPGCGEEWPLEDLYFARIKPGGYFRTRCRACCIARQRAEEET